MNTKTTNPPKAKRASQDERIINASARAIGPCHLPSTQEIIAAQDKTAHTPSWAHKEWCAALPNSEASRALGRYTGQKRVACYCDCGADDNSDKGWMLVEDLDGLYVYARTVDQDGIIFGRTPPISKMIDRDRNPKEVMKLARLIAAAPTMLQALKDLTAQIQLGKLNIRKDFSLMNAHAAATKAIAKAEGNS